MSSVQNAVVVSDSHAIIKHVNAEACKLFGYPRTELIGQNVSMLMASPYKEQHDSYVRRLEGTGQAHVLGTSRLVEARYNTKPDEPPRTLHLRLSLARIVNEGVVSYIGMFEEVPDNRVEIDIDANGIITRVSPNVNESLGYRAKALVGQSLSVMIPPPHDALHDSYVREYHRRKCPAESTIVGHVRNVNARTANGQQVPVRLDVQQVKAPDGSISLRGFVTPVDPELDAVVTINSSGIIQSVNEAFSTILGYKAEEVIGKNVKIIATAPHSELHDLYLERYMLNRVARVVGKPPRRVYARHIDGSTFLINLQVEEFQRGEEVFFSGHMSRVSKRQDLQEEADDLPDGMIIGLYKLEKTLGKGYFGKVKMACHSLTNEKVAIKTLRKKQYEKIGMVFPPREIALLKRMRHCYICKLYDVIETGEKAYLIQELVTRGELYDYISKRNMLHEDEARHFFRQIACALDYMHRHGVTHRDLKSENVLLDQFGNVKVIDFGLGNFWTGDLLSTFCGTPAYAAPELWNATPYEGPGVDVWSLGVLLYLMLTGTLPFADIQDVVVAKYKAPSTSSESRALLAGILTPNPKKRMTLKEVCEHPWTNKGYDFTPLNDPRALRSEQIDDSVLAQLPKYGFDPEEARQALQHFEHNQFTATYSLLYDQAERARSEQDDSTRLPDEIKPTYPHTRDATAEESRSQCCMM